MSGRTHRGTHKFNRVAGKLDTQGENCWKCWKNKPSPDNKDLWQRQAVSLSMYLNSLSLINKVSTARASAAFSTWASLWQCKDTKVVGYLCEWMRTPHVGHCLLTVLVHHRSPIEGSVGLMLEHLIEVLQGFNLSCCLEVKHKYQLVTFVQLDSRFFTGWCIKQTSHLGIRESACHSGIREDFCKATSISVRFHPMNCDCFLLTPWIVIVLFSEPTSSYLWVSTCDLMTSGPAWIWVDSPAGSCCRVAPPLYTGRWWTGPSQTLD